MEIMGGGEGEGRKREGSAENVQCNKTIKNKTKQAKKRFIFELGDQVRQVSSTHSD